MMNIKECYDAFGGDYEDTKQRLYKEEIIQKFVLQFIRDSHFELLCKAIEDKDYKQAFLEAHTLKGISLNLGFKRLGISVGALTELFRNNEEKKIDTEQCNELLQQVKNDYIMIINAVKQLDTALSEDV